MAAKKRAIGYVRVSTTEQATAGFGLDVQRRAIREFAKANGLQLAAILADEGISGSNGLDTRIGLADVRSRAVAGEVGAIIVYRLDRLARDLGLQESFLADMRKAKVDVYSVTEPDIDSEDGTRVLMRQVLGAVAQYERWTIRTRMMAGKAAKVSRGGYGGGRPPFGYRAEGRELVPDEREQVVIATIRRLSSEGLSSRQIAARLDEMGDEYRPKVGATWTSMAVLRVLQRS